MTAPNPGVAESVCACGHSEEMHGTTPATGRPCYQPVVSGGAAIGAIWCSCTCYTPAPEEDHPVTAPDPVDPADIVNDGWCKHCCESITLVNYLTGPQWMHNPPGYTGLKMGGGAYNVFRHCRKSVATPVPDGSGQ